MELTFEVQRQEDKPILYCHGHVICGHEAEALQKAIVRLLAVAEQVTIDLAGVKKMDCAGLGVIVTCLGLARKRGRSLQLRSVPLHVRQMIRVTGLQAYMNVEDRPYSPSVGAFAA